jgi:hypothetical protein
MILYHTSLLFIVSPIVSPASLLSIFAVSSRVQICKVEKNENLMAGLDLPSLEQRKLMFFRSLEVDAGL